MSDQRPPANGVGLGSPFGVPIYLSWTWFAGALVITWLFVPLVNNRLPGLQGWAVPVAFCFAVLLGLSVLIHELAHAVTALRFGQSVRQITLHLLGGVSEIEGEQRRPWVDFVIALVGPLASLVLAAFGFLLIQALPEQTVGYLVAWQLTVANLIVGIFNLVPGLPLDGGRMLRDVVWAVSGREYLGTIVAAWTGRALAGLMVALALLPLLFGDNDPVWLVWGLLLASFIWLEAGRALQAARVRSVLPRVSARSLTRRALPVPEDLSVSEGLRRAEAAQAGALVTVDRAGHPVGLVHEAAVAALPEARRPWVTLAAVARALPSEGRITADLEGTDLIEQLAAHPAAEYLVVDPEGSVYGVLTRADVESAIAALAQGR